MFFLLGDCNLFACPEICCHILKLSACRSQLVNYCSIIGAEKPLVIAEQLADSMQAGKPAMPFGTGGMSPGRLVRDTK